MTRALIEAGPSEAGWHWTSDILTCPRKFALAHLVTGERNLEGKDALIRGILWHTAMAHRYAMMLPGGTSTYLAPRDAVIEAARREPVLQAWVPAVLHAIAAYVKHWGTEERWEVLEVEKEWRARLRLPMDSGED